MTYHIYQTEGVVLGGGDTSEDSRIVRIYTKEHGLIVAKAQAARKLASKHRYHLQDLSYGRFSFVRGRGLWRLVGSEQFLDSPSFTEAPEKFRSFVKISRLLERVAPEEDIHDQPGNFFPDYVNAFQFLFSTELTRAEVKSFETFLALKMLFYHGYWSEREEGVLHTKHISRDVLREVSGDRLRLNKQIHQAFEHSQL